MPIRSSPHPPAQAGGNARFGLVLVSIFPFDRPRNGGQAFPGVFERASTRLLTPGNAVTAQNPRPAPREPGQPPMRWAGELRRGGSPRCCSGCQDRSRSGRRRGSSWRCSRCCRHAGRASLFRLSISASLMDGLPKVTIGIRFKIPMRGERSWRRPTNARVKQSSFTPTLAFPAEAGPAHGCARPDTWPHPYARPGRPRDAAARAGPSLRSRTRLRIR